MLAFLGNKATGDYPLQLGRTVSLGRTCQLTISSRSKQGAVSISASTPQERCPRNAKDKGQGYFQEKPSSEGHQDHPNPYLPCKDFPPPIFYSFQYSQIRDPRVKQLDEWTWPQYTATEE